MIFVLVIIISGCVSTKATMTTGQKRPPISPDEVKIYDSIEKVPGKYEEVALLTSKGDYRHTDYADMYNSMKEEAAKIGANGIILGNIEDPSTRDLIIDGIFGWPSQIRGKATAIYVFPTQEDEAVTDVK